jgi:hypothetical protein
MSIASLRRYKILGLAAFDLISGIIGMVALFLLSKWYYGNKAPWWNYAISALIVTIPIGIAIHVLFGVSTALNRYIGLD